MEVGDRNVDPEGVYLWSDLEIRADRTATYRLRSCADEPFRTVELEWAYDEVAGVLRAQPGPGEDDRLGACDGAVVELALGEACGELWMRVTEPEACMSQTWEERFLPGRVCPELIEHEGATPQFGDTCFFEIAWCDDRPLPACQAP